MNSVDLLSRLAVALGIGLLMGLERGWKLREAEAGSRAAGIRTFALSGLTGGIAGALTQALGPGAGGGLLFGLCAAAYAAVLALFERDAGLKADNYSATTTIAGLLCFALGGYAMLGDMRVAAAAAVAATGILALRENIHGLVARMTWPELRSVLVLLAMTFIILPAVPDENVGPSGGVNLREVWLIAIVLAAISFLGYAAVRMFGTHRGVLLASFAGGLVSSTAVTLANAKRAAAGEGAPSLLLAGIAIATGVSFLRVGAIVAFINPRLLVHVGPPLMAALLMAAFFALPALREAVPAKAPKRGQAPPPEFKNPFSFWPVVGFAVFLGVVIVLGQAIGERFSSQGAFLSAIALGLTDVDAVTVSLSRLVPGTLDASSASRSILVAVAANMVAKAVIAGMVARGPFALRIAALTAGCGMAGVAALAATAAWRAVEG